MTFHCHCNVNVIAYDAISPPLTKIYIQRCTAHTVSALLCALRNIQLSTLDFPHDDREVRSERIKSEVEKTVVEVEENEGGGR